MEDLPLIHFIGAGPGDPDLLTLKGGWLVAEADVIIYAGSLVNPAILAMARPEAVVYNSAGMSLAEQVEVMVAAAAQGQRVARLHTGDPAVYGATLEQMRALDRAGIAYQVVPGVSSAFAAAAALGVELTVPGPEGTQTIIFSRLAGRTAVPERESLRSLAVHRASLVLFLSTGMITGVVEELYAAGYDPGTPIAVVFRASWPDELVIHGTLADIASRLQQAELTHQALIIVSPALQPEARSEAAPVSHLYGAAQVAAERQPTVAIVTLTRTGTQTGRRLQTLLPGATLYAPARFGEASDAAPGQVLYTTSVRQALQTAFEGHAALVCIMASGIVVRDLAPLLRSKHTDPAVVVLDERGQYAVSLLSGHQGGANVLARQVADLLGGTAVVTTASDGQDLPALDLLGREAGWVIQGEENLTAASAALVNDETVGVVQEAGDETWWPEPVPATLVRFASLAELQAAAPPAALVITCRHIPAEVAGTIPCLVRYHPPCLAVGVGCNRGTPAGEILAAIDQTLAEAGLEPASISCLATIEDKADEFGLLAAAQARAWPLRLFSRPEIAAMGSLPNPSPWAQQALGVPGVAEPAALLGAGAGAELVVEKRKFANVTVAVAKTITRRVTR